MGGVRETLWEDEYLCWPGPGVTRTMGDQEPAEPHESLVDDNKILRQEYAYWELNSWVWLLGKHRGLMTNTCAAVIRVLTPTADKYYWHCIVLCYQRSQKIKFFPQRLRVTSVWHQKTNIGQDLILLNQTLKESLVIKNILRHTQDRKDEYFKKFLYSFLQVLAEVRSYICGCYFVS